MGFTWVVYQIRYTPASLRFQGAPVCIASLLTPAG